jgi:hypothetical protein
VRRHLCHARFSCSRSFPSFRRGWECTRTRRYLLAQRDGHSARLWRWGPILHHLRSSCRLRWRVGDVGCWCWYCSSAGPGGRVGLRCCSCCCGRSYFGLGGRLLLLRSLRCHSLRFLSNDGVVEVDWNGRHGCCCYRLSWCSCEVLKVEGMKGSRAMSSKEEVAKWPQATRHVPCIAVSRVRKLGNDVSRHVHSQCQIPAVIVIEQLPEEDR